MLVDIRTRHLPSNPLVETQTQERFAKTLSSFAPQIRGVVVRLVDVNGPRGGIDKLCRATVSLTNGGTLLAEARGENVGQAVALAATRTRARLGRWSQKRERAWQRPAGMLPSP